MQQLDEPMEPVMSSRQNNIKALFESVFWPAAAGNVFWSLCALLVDKTSAPLLRAEVVSRLLVLVFLSLYLAIEWLRNYRNFPKNVPVKFWVFDGLHICAVIFVALTASIRPTGLVCAAGAYFLVTAVGHFCNAWEAAESNNVDRFWLGVINLLGAAIIVVGVVMRLEVWHLPASFFIVIVIWGLYRRVSICALFVR